MKVSCATIAYTDRYPVWIPMDFPGEVDKALRINRLVFLRYMSEKK